MKQSLTISIKIIRFFIYFIPIGIIGFLLWIHFIPLGVFSVKCKKTCSVPVQNIKSSGGDLVKDKDGLWLATNPVVEFDVALPQDFKNGEFVLQAPESNNISTLQVGILKNGTDNYIENRLLFAGKITQLKSPEWQKIENDDIVFYYRDLKQRFNAVEDFLENIPSLDTIAQSNFDLRPYYKVPGYVADNKKITISENLKGSYRILTYVKDEPLDFSFDFTREDGEEINGKIKTSFVFGPMELINELDIQNNNAHVFLPNLREGTYAIDVDIPDEIVTTKIEAMQNWLIFANSLNFDERSHQTKIYYGFEWQSMWLSKKTQHISGESFYYFSPDQFFVPPYSILENVQDFTSAPVDKVNYYLIRKPFPTVNQTKNGMEMRASFNDLTEYSNNDIIHFQLKAEPLTGSWYKFEEFEINFYN